MFRSFRHSLLAALVIITPASLSAQGLDLIDKPKTAAQFWRALKFEIASGKFDQAGDYLSGFLATNPTNEVLLDIEQKEGISAFLELRNVPKWSDNPKIQAVARQNVETLINRVTDALRKFRSDPVRIAKFVRNLTASREEREFAIVELRKSGASAIPHLVAQLLGADVDDRLAMLNAIPLLGPESVPPLLAAIDADSPALKGDIIESLGKRADIVSLMGKSETDIMPTLWHLSSQPGTVGAQARNMIVTLKGRSPSQLAPAVEELTRAADAIYYHKATFAKSTEEQTIWYWEANKVQSRKVTVTAAEEFYGLRYARWALAIDPNHEPALMTFLSIAVEKSYERTGFDARLAKSAPAVHELLALTPSRVLLRMLDRALTDGRSSVALGIVQVLGERAETRGVPSASRMATESRNPDAHRTAPDSVVRALNSQDRRVAQAAADAILRIPGPPAAGVPARVVEIYRSALAAGEAMTMTRPKALIADADSTRADLLAETVRQAGFDSVVVHTGRDALKRLSAASDIDVVWVDHEIPYPQLPYFLSQVRADYRYGRLPVMVTLSSNPELGRLPELDVRLGRLTSAVAGVKVVDKTPLRIELAYDALATDVAAIETWLKSVTHDHPKLKVTTDSVLYVRIDTVAYKEPTNEMIQQLREMTIDLFEIKVVQESPTRTLLGISSDRQAPAELEARMQRFVRDYKETRVTREVATRVVITSGVSMAVPIDVERRVLAQAQPHRNTQVVNRPVTPEAVVSGLLAVADTAGRPLSPAERKDSQIRAIDALRKMATGVISGYDVRPAASEIRAAMLNDELAPAAIEATGRMSGTDSQNALAAVALNEKRPGPIRVLAAGELVRHIQAHGSGAINDAMLKQLIRAAESDPNADLKMAMQLVVGAFSNDRVLANLPNDDARAKWVNRVIRYVPAAPGGAALAPAPAPAEKKDEGN